MIHPYSSRRRPTRWICALLLITPLVIDSLVRAESASRPFWTEQAMFRFGDELFFVGQSSCADTAEEGRQRAFAHGVQELLNYTQARSAAGIEVVTQMVFEEFTAQGCPAGTVTVWRLLRADVDKVSQLLRRSLNRPRSDTRRPALRPQDLTPRFGMSREEILERFGRPWSVMLRRGSSDVTWDYRFGLSLVLDRDNYLKRWRLAGPHERQPGVNARLDVDLAPPLDLTARLGQIEDISEHPANVVHDRAGFASHAHSLHVAERPSAHERARQSFTPITRDIPGLATLDRYSGLRTSGEIVLRCDMAVYTLSIGHLDDASGPQISSDHRFTDTTEVALRSAVQAAAKATGYDARYLSVRLSLALPRPSQIVFLEAGSIEGSSAGASWAVSIASAILGDPIHLDVTLLGSIGPRLDIGPPIEDLDGKIGGCRQPRSVELILPEGQPSMDLTLRKLGVGIRVTEVRNLAEAYEAATGALLRTAR